MGDKKVSLHEHSKALYPGSLKINLLIFSFKEVPFIQSITPTDAIFKSAMMAVSCLFR